MRLARLAANLNQNDVAQQLGMGAKSGTTVLAWEKGRRDPKAGQIAEMARIYGVKASLFADPPKTDEERLVEYRLEETPPDVVVEPAEAVATDQTERQRAWWLGMARERAGLGQGRLAFLMGVTTRTIQSWEERRATPTIQQESRLAELLDVPIARPPKAEAQRTRRKTA